MKFRTRVLSALKNATGIEVPEDIVTALAAGKKPAVTVTINGHTYRSSIATMGGKFMIGISAENRGKAGVAAGDNIEVDIELDNEPRTVEIPVDLAAALKKNTAASKYFESLSYSHKLQHVLPITQAKTEDTRQRRIDKTVSILEQGKQ